MTRYVIISANELYYDILNNKLNILRAVFKRFAKIHTPKDYTDNLVMIWESDFKILLEKAGEKKDE